MRDRTLILIAVGFAITLGIAQAIYFRDPSCLLVRCVKAHP